MTVGKVVSTDAPRTSEPNQPLAGTSATAVGSSTALAVAADHLARLGCEIAQDAQGPDAEGAGTLGIACGAGAGAEPHVLTCAIDWAGPVELPLASEADVQAACGIAHVHGRRYGRPTPLRLDYAEAVTGVLAVTGALAALHAARRGVRIDEVRTSVAQGALLAVGQYLAVATAADDVRIPAPPTAPDAAAPPFTSGDGVRFEIETLDAEVWQRFWAVLGADLSAIRRGWPPFQHRYATGVCPLPAELHRATARTPYSVIRTAAAQAGVSVLRVRDLGREELLAPPRAPWTVTPLPADRHATPGLSPAVPPPAPHRPLAGLVVVESTGRVQGPLAGHALALLGARVIRVEPPGGDPMRGTAPMAGDCSARFLALNRGKEAVEADLRTPGGRGTVRELVRDADVFLHNWAPGKAAAWQLDAADLAGVRPGLVHAWASGWGDAMGPTPPIGTDYVVQAGAGLAELTARPGEPPTPSLMTLLDVLGGLVCAEGVLAALLARAATGHGRRVHTSLLSAATVLTAHGRGAASDPRQPAPPVPLCTDLTELAADPRFSAALIRDDCVLPGRPWEFTA
ncbi:CoA transferase [Streptomyces antnestii]|uniref:CoA transferase n=1 Tax=Streptomyces antnestii TaxID=2494256 RepID=A0A437PN37_9ACTN|nr:CoA transferase [Streptomyces sp. San01]RVU23675.1 CoA transferase [Streptomyces sp. San01]